MQVNKRCIIVRAMRRLVEPLTVERERSTGRSEPARGPDNVTFWHAADPGSACRRVSHHRLLQRLEAFGVRSDIVTIDQFFCQQHMQQAVEEGNVGAGPQCQMQIGNPGCFATPWVNDDDLELGVGDPGILDTAEDNRMRHGRVRASD